MIVDVQPLNTTREETYWKAVTGITNFCWHYWRKRLAKVVLWQLTMSPLGFFCAGGETGMDDYGMAVGSWLLIRQGHRECVGELGQLLCCFRVAGLFQRCGRYCNLEYIFELIKRC